MSWKLPKIGSIWHGPGGTELRVMRNAWCGRTRDQMVLAKQINLPKSYYVSPDAWNWVHPLPEWNNKFKMITENIFEPNIGQMWKIDGKFYNVNLKTDKLYIDKVPTVIQSTFAIVSLKEWDDFIKKSDNVELLD